jgi:hypothetical protein
MPERTQPQSHTHPRTSAPHRRSSALPKRRSRRGGRRPGAGARPGNLNALKHGRYSQQFAAFGAIMAQDPRARAFLMQFAIQHDLRQQKLEDIAAHFFDRLMTHARNIAAGKPSPGPFSGLLGAARAEKTRRRRKTDS